MESKNMRTIESEIEELEAAREAACNQAKEKGQELKDQVFAVFKNYCSFDKHFCDNLDMDWSYSHPGLMLRTELGYWDEEENRTNFGSTFDLYIYLEEGVIEINKGTIGSYTIGDKFQVKRDIDVANIWLNYNLIMDEIKAIDISAYKELRNQICEIDQKIQALHDDIQENKRDEVFESLKVGNTYQANDCVNFGYRKIIRKNQEFEITRIAATKVKVGFGNNEFFIDMGRFIDYVIKGTFEEI